MRSEELRPLSKESLALLQGWADNNGGQVFAVPFEEIFGAEPKPPAPLTAVVDQRIHFAKQLIGYATSLPDSKIAKLAGVAIETVTQLRRPANES